MRGLHTDVITKRGLGPVAAGTTGTGVTGKAVDRRGYRRVEAICSYGTVTATSATITLTLFEGDVTGTMTSVADADLDGTEALASLVAATPRTSDTTKLFTKRIGYKGTKRYVKAKLVPTVTATTPVSVVFVLSEPESAPTSPTQ